MSKDEADSALDALAERARAGEHRPVLAAISYECWRRARLRGERERWRHGLEQACELQRAMGAGARAQRVEEELNEGWRNEG